MAGILLTSPVVKYLAERYDVKYTGRQITMDRIYVNPFSGFIHIRNLKIFESYDTLTQVNEDSLFFSAKEVTANFAMVNLLFKTFEITMLTLDQPKGIIIQNNKAYNISDLINKFTATGKFKTSKPFHFNILNIKIRNGEFYYRDETTPASYYIKEVNFESAGKYWYEDTIAATISMQSGPGSGSAKGNFTINFKSQDYRLLGNVHSFDLKFFEPYFRELVNYGTFRGSIDADIKATGNLTDRDKLDSKGKLQLNDFHVGKNPGDDYASFDTLALTILDLNPENHRYNFDSLILKRPYFKFERYDYLNNLEMMFGKNGSKISEADADPTRFNLIIQIADYMKVLARNFFQSNYKLNKLAIYNGDIKFNDYSMTEKFSIEANPIFITADSINKGQNRVEALFKSGIQPYGNLSAALSLNPNDSSDFDLQYNLQGIPVSVFNPYLITYTSFPLDRGTMNINGQWKVRKGIIKSDNHFLVNDPRLANRIINKNTNWVPLPLILFFITNNGNVIDFNIPITGNLKDPGFKLWDVFSDILKNVLVKPPATPYRVEIRNLESKIDNSLVLKWRMPQRSLLPEQEKFVNNMVDFLIKNPEASIIVYPMQFADHDKEYISFFEAKKKYFLSKYQNTRSLNEEDSLKVCKMSIKDSLFVRYLDKQLNDTMLFTIQEKCIKYIGSSLIESKFRQLNKERKEAFMANFKNKKVESRVRIRAGENGVPYNGFSFYKIIYKGELPAYLIKSYQQMDELNDIAPRIKFENDTEKSNGMP